MPTATPCPASATAWRRSLLLISLALAAGGCGETAPRSAEVRPVRTVVVEPQTVEDDRRVVGEVRPRFESELGFRVAGKVTARLVDVGTAVKKGAVLARLDQQDYRNKLKAAEADHAAAQAALTESQGAENRLARLLATGTTTRSTYDAALKNFRTAEAKLASARAALQLARDELGYADLHAEFDGVVTAVGAEPGQVVGSGRMIVRLARPEDKDAVFAVAEAAFGDRRAKERPEVTVALLSNPAIVAAGTVREIAPVADPATRTYQVKVSLRDPPEEMRFGGSVVASRKSAGAPVVVLPGSAMFDRAGQPAVWVVDPAAGVVGLKDIVVARYETDRVIVGEGLSRGDIVVIAGVNRLRESQKVRLADGAAR